MNNKFDFNKVEAAVVAVEEAAAVVVVVVEEVAVDTAATEPLTTT